jgi:hypothetical protein
VGELDARVGDLPRCRYLAVVCLLPPARRDRPGRAKKSDGRLVLSGVLSSDVEPPGRSAGWPPPISLWFRGLADRNTG